MLSTSQDCQAMMLSELLTVAGGPVMWEVFRHAQIVYERYRNEQLSSIQECVVVNDPPPGPVSAPQSSPEKVPTRVYLSLLLFFCTIYKEVYFIVHNTVLTENTKRLGHLIDCQRRLLVKYRNKVRAGHKIRDIGADYISIHIKMSILKY